MKRHVLLLFLALPFVPAAPAARAAEIRVLSGGAPKDAMAVLIPRFEAKSGHHVVMRYDVVSSHVAQVEAGDRPDMVLLPDTALAELAKRHKLRPSGSAPFGTVRLIAIVPAGRPLPDIATADTFRDALLAARSVVWAPPAATPSGAHLARVAARLGIADALAGKLTLKPALDGGAALVAAGKAELGIYPASEVVHVSGISRVGPLPSALQLSLTYGGAVLGGTAPPEPSLEFIRFLAGDEAKAAWREAGFDPP